MCEAAYPCWLRKSAGPRVKDQTLAKISLHLDRILVNRDCLTWDKGTLVGGLLEGHNLTKDTSSGAVNDPENETRPYLVNSRGIHVANVIT